MEEFRCRPIPSTGDVGSEDTVEALSPVQRCLDVAAEHRAAIKTHHQQIVFVHRELNQLRPINALPHELLADIFILYADTHAQALARNYTASDSPDFPSKGDVPYQWIDVSYVCHSWRCISLSTPRLWRYIIVNCPYIAMECITRSQNMPLVVWRFGDSWLGTPQKEVLRAVLPQLSRISDLRISTFDESFTWLPQKGDRVLSAPLLTTLSCAARGYARTALSFVLKLKPPKLSHLVVSYSDSHDWISHEYPPNLEYLRVSINFDFSTALGKIDLHGGLSRLQTLIIINSSYKRSPFEPEIETHPELPCLKLLQISSHNFRSLSHYLGLFKFPNSTQIRLSTGDQLIDFDQILKHFGYPEFRTFAVKALSVKDWYTLYGWTELHSVQQIRVEDKPPLLALACRVSELEMKNFSTAFASTLQYVHTLELVQTDQNEPKLFPVICGHAANVREFGMDGIFAFMDGVWGSVPPLVQSLAVQSAPLKLYRGDRDRLRRFLQSRVNSFTKLQRLGVASRAWGVKDGDLRALVGEVVAMDYPEEVRPWDSYEFF